VFGFNNSKTIYLVVSPQIHNKLKIMLNISKNYLIKIVSQGQSKINYILTKT